MTIETLDLLCPAVAGMDTALKQSALNAAAGFVPAAIVEPNKTNAAIYYAGWVLSKHKHKNDTTNGIKSKTEGDLSITYKDGASGDDPYGYYKEYLRLIGGKVDKSGNPINGGGTPAAAKVGAIMAGNVKH